MLVGALVVLAQALEALGHVHVARRCLETALAQWRTTQLGAQLTHPFSLRLLDKLVHVMRRTNCDEEALRIAAGR